MNGVTLGFEESGSGQTVVLSHGIPNDYRVWAPVVTKLAQGYRTISYSRRCAFPNHCTDYASSSIENNAEDLAQLITAIGGGPVHLVGHSYAGPVVTTVALNHPELVRSLVLIEPYLTKVVVDESNLTASLGLLVTRPSVAVSGLGSKNNLNTAIREVARGNAERAIDPYYVRTWQDRDVRVPLSPANRAMMHENMGTFSELLTPAPTFDKQDVARLSPPTLIMSGEHTFPFMKALSVTLHQSIPGSQLAVVPNAGHYPNMENPAACGEAIASFIRGLH